MGNVSESFKNFILFSELVPLIDEPRGMIRVEPHHITKPQLKRDFIKLLFFLTIFNHKKRLFVDLRQNLLDFGQTNKDNNQKCLDDLDTIIVHRVRICRLFQC